MADAKQASNRGRILFVVRPAAGGIRRHVSTLAARLPEHGFDVSVAAPPDVSLEAGSTQTPHYPVQISSRTNPFSDLLAAREVARLGREADILHGHGLRGAWIAALAARFSGVPFVFTAHNLVPSSPGVLARISLRYVVRRAATAICVSNAIGDGLRAYAPPNARIEVIPNGIDVALYDGTIDRAAVARELKLPEVALSPDARWIVGVGRLSPEKGFDTLITMASTMRDITPPVFFILAGDGPIRGLLEDEIELEFIEDCMFMPGYVKDVPALLRAADVIVIPSLEEGQGIVALEAMAARTPVIASRVGGLIQTVGDAGVLISPKIVSDFAKECAALLADDERRSHLAEAGRHRVEEYYRVDQMIDRTVKLYDDVLRR